MTMADDGQRESLEYKLLGSGGQVGAWGHEYVRHLAAEVGEEYNARLAAADMAADKARSSAKAAVDGPGAPSDVGDDAMETEVLVQPAELLLPLVVDEMVPFFVQNNAEAEAIDLLMEVGKLEALTPHVDATNCDRICMYLLQVAQYVPEPEDAQVGRAWRGLHPQGGEGGCYLGERGVAARTAVRAEAGGLAMAIAVEGASKWGEVCLCVEGEWDQAGREDGRG